MSDSGNGKDDPLGGGNNEGEGEGGEPYVNEEDVGEEEEFDAGDVVGDEVEEEEDDEDDEEFLAPDHPLMARIQSALNKQLSNQNQRVTLGLREKEKEVSNVKSKREKIGVELYTLQQGLAKLQMQLEKTHDRYNECFNARTESEVALKRVHAEYAEKQEEKELLEKKRAKTRKEVDKLLITVQQIEEFNSKVKSEIMVTRRAAYGTEQAMQMMEGRKRTQDEVLDELNEQLRKNDEQLRIHEGQIKAQQEETDSARDALKEALEDMELIMVEKREYLQKWKHSLIGMANRDTALQAAEEALNNEKESVAQLDLEIKGYRQSIKQSQEENEKLTGRLTKTESEIQFIDNQLSSISEQRRELNEKYMMLRSTMERTDRDLGQARNRQKNIKGEIQTVHKQYEKLVQEKQKVDDTIMENLSDQSTIEKGAQNVWKATLKLKADIHEKEIKMGEIENELTRIKVDALNTGAHNKELGTTLEAYDNELKEKDKLIEKYETEIRQRHDKIEKKQMYIARLNRKFEELTSNQQDENTGPLEATIKNLNKEITGLQKNTGEQQKEWIRSQTELVGLVSQTTDEMEKVDELKARQTILAQKRLRLLNTLSSHNAEIKDLDKKIKGMHNDMAKLNDLISKNVKQAEELQNQTYNMETEFMNSLKELELQSVKMDSMITRIKEEKEATFEEVVEIEKQIMLWEKKIQLERETQEALDPEYGQPEILGMKKEIHRMKLRLSQLQRQQEKMICEMERVIEKREHIKMGNIATMAKGHGGVTHAQLNKKIGNLKTTLKMNVMESKKVVGDISRQEEQNKKLLEELEGQQQRYSQVEDRKYELDENLANVYFKKQMNMEKILMYRKRTQRYDEAAEAKLKITGDREYLESELSRSSEKLEKMKDAINKLQSENPKYANYFARLLSYA